MFYVFVFEQIYIEEFKKKNGCKVMVMVIFCLFLLFLENQFFNYFLGINNVEIYDY